MLIKFLYQNAARQSTAHFCVIRVGAGCLKRQLSILVRQISERRLIVESHNGRHYVRQTCMPANIVMWSRLFVTNDNPPTEEVAKFVEVEKSEMKRIEKKSLEVGTEALPVEKKPVTDKEAPQDVVMEKKSLMTEAEQQSKKTNMLKEVVNKVMPGKKRVRVDLTASSMERNFITPVRAMSDFLLKPSDLEGLRKTKRRSPYESEPPITVYWRKDVESKAIEVWGSRENLIKELLIRDAKRKTYQQTEPGSKQNADIFTVKRRLRDFRREKGYRSGASRESGLLGASGKVVLTAIAINGSNFLFKLFAWLYTGSHSMFSESIHSLADTINQLILAFGIHKSVQQADSDHPYGYSNMKYVASLISGVGIFCVGTGLSFYHGVTGLLSPMPTGSFYWAFFILGGSLVSEGATLLVAVNSIRKGDRKSVV